MTANLSVHEAEPAAVPYGVVAGALSRAPVPPAPISGTHAARCVRAYLSARRARAAILDIDLFSDPAWDILLDLYASHHEHRQVTVSDASIAAVVPPSTGLRWVNRLVDEGAVVRRPDPFDGRRSFLTLAPETARRIDVWVTARLPGFAGR